MTANLIQPDGVAPVFYRCKCGKNCLVHVLPVSGGAIGGHTFKHCEEDEVHTLPPITSGWWEEHPGQWMPISFPD
jgi:hypothetical protein